MEGGGRDLKIQRTGWIRNNQRKKSARSGSFFSFQRCFWCFFLGKTMPITVDPLICPWASWGFRLQGEDYIHLLSLAYTLIAERRDSDSVFVDWPLGTLDEDGWRSFHAWPWGSDQERLWRSSPDFLSMFIRSSEWVSRHQPIKPHYKILQLLFWEGHRLTP